MMLRRLRLVLRPWLLQSAFTEIEIAKMKVGNVVFSLAEKKGNDMASPWRWQMLIGRKCLKLGGDSRGGAPTSYRHPWKTIYCYIFGISYQWCQKKRNPITSGNGSNNHSLKDKTKTPSSDTDRNELPCVAATFLKIRTPKMKKARKAENMHLKSRKPEFLFIFLFLYTLPMGLLVHFTMAAAIDDGNIHFNLTDFTPNMPHIQFEADTTASGGQIQLTTNQRNKPLNVEFDMYPNVYDPPGLDHVAMDLNSIRTSFYPVQWTWSGIEHGGNVDAFITYNSSTKNLSVFLLGAEDFNRLNSSNLSATLDLSQYLPEWVTFGFSVSTGSSIELHTIYSWSFSSNLQVSMNKTINLPNVPPIPPFDPRRKKQTWLRVVLAIVGCISTLLLVLSLVWLFCRRRKYRRMREDGTISFNVDVEMVTAPRKFSYKELRLATNNFADEGLLGEGGFGKVYLGFLRDINSNIAVKRITPNSQQGVKEYESEITTIIKLRHRNLVQLIG
ncbi:L-type lectin-domain containing receptor kinase IX.2-like [Gossypium arboreum]|uniref:L-type lectin-domain containing receptor kinase IX.2-like n=1 Tax=Gossypium arboreum TaxID=29729 RepID=UPI0022F1B62D|nr:L-type lectin-domain containing receptor kinase IX.2-like [Gossypium arboreum]